jgi:D-glycero-D-manno-heptose 1,7-bisphosphate phosphatase
MGVGEIGRPAIFLDRDGTLVEEIFYPETGEKEAPLSAEDVRLIEGAAGAARRLAEAGFLLILISNQGAYAKGKTSLRDLWLAHERFLELLRGEGVRLDGFFYSFSHPDGITPFFSGPSIDRKPNPYNILLAAAQFDIDLPGSWTIGDRESDVACGRAARTRTVRIFVQNGNLDPDSGADIVAPDLQEAGDRILQAGSAARGSALT